MNANRTVSAIMVIVLVAVSLLTAYLPVPVVQATNTADQFAHRDRIDNHSQLRPFGFAIKALVRAD
jgi:hypothetical protein